MHRVRYICLPLGGSLPALQIYIPDEEASFEPLDLTLDFDASMTRILTSVMRCNFYLSLSFSF